MSAGGSVARWGQEQRRAARAGVWRKVLAWLRLNPAARRADARAAACEAGAKGEQMTAALLSVLEAEGWLVLHDRAIPGARTANADHVLVSPGAKVFLVDSKLWSAKWPVHGEGGRLRHGRMDRDQAVRSVGYETQLVSRALETTVQPVIAVHNAPVAGGGFMVDGVPVIPAASLVGVLRANDGYPDPAAARRLMLFAVQRLPEYGAGS